jgi:hypothetical protein
MNNFEGAGRRSNADRSDDLNVASYWRARHGLCFGECRAIEMEAGEMKRRQTAVATTALILLTFTSNANNQAVAASARCAAGCANYCATKFAWKNTTACNEMCQAKRCK